MVGRSDSSSSSSDDESPARSVQSAAVPAPPSLPPPALDKDEPRKSFGIKVQNLPVRSTDTSLKDGLFHEFKKYGKVTSVQIHGALEERYGLVFFRQQEDQEKALGASKGKLFFGMQIEVTAWNGPETESENEFRPLDERIDEFHPKATRTLFIGNLEKTTSYHDLLNIFQRFGDIVDIDIKKVNGAPQYAFLQYCDIASVCKAIKKMDGEYLGNNRLKLGFGKSMPTTCVWLDGLASNITEQYLTRHFCRYGHVLKVVFDRLKGMALILYNNIEYAQAAVKETKGWKIGGNKIKVDFANQESQVAFYRSMQASGQDIGREFYEIPPERRDERRPPYHDYSADRAYYENMRAQGTYVEDPRREYVARSREFYPEWDPYQGDYYDPRYFDDPREYRDYRDPYEQDIRKFYLQRERERERERDSDRRIYSRSSEGSGSCSSVSPPRYEKSDKMRPDRYGKGEKPEKDRPLFEVERGSAGEKDKRPGRKEKTDKEKGEKAKLRKVKVPSPSIPSSDTDPEPDREASPDALAQSKSGKLLAKDKDGSSKGRLDLPLPPCVVQLTRVKEKEGKLLDQPGPEKLRQKGENDSARSQPLPLPASTDSKAVLSRLELPKGEPLKQGKVAKEKAVASQVEVVDKEGKTKLKKHLKSEPGTDSSNSSLDIDKLAARKRRFGEASGKSDRPKRISQEEEEGRFGLKKLSDIGASNAVAKENEVDRKVVRKEAHKKGPQKPKTERLVTVCSPKERQLSMDLKARLGEPTEEATDLSDISGTVAKSQSHPNTALMFSEEGSLDHNDTRQPEQQSYVELCEQALVEEKSTGVGQEHASLDIDHSQSYRKQMEQSRKLRQQLQSDKPDKPGSPRGTDTEDFEHRSLVHEVGKPPQDVTDDSPPSKRKKVEAFDYDLTTKRERNYRSSRQVSEDSERNMASPPGLRPFAYHEEEGAAKETKESPKMEDKVYPHLDLLKYSLDSTISKARTSHQELPKLKAASLGCEEELQQRWESRAKQDPRLPDMSFPGSLLKRESLRHRLLIDLEPGEVPSDSEEDGERKNHSPKPSTSLSYFLRDRRFSDLRLPTSLEKNKFYSFAQEQTITPDTKALLERAKSLSSSREDNWPILNRDSHVSSFRSSKDKDKVESTPRPIPSWYMKKKKIRTDSEGKLEDKKEEPKPEEHERQELFASRFLHSSIFEQDSRRLQHLERKEEDIELGFGHQSGKLGTMEGQPGLGAGDLQQEPVVLFHELFLEVIGQQQKEREQRLRETEKASMPFEVSPPHGKYAVQTVSPDHSDLPMKEDHLEAEKVSPSLSLPLPEEAMEHVREEEALTVKEEEVPPAKAKSQDGEEAEKPECPPGVQMQTCDDMEAEPVLPSRKLKSKRTKLTPPAPQSDVVQTANSEKQAIRKSERIDREKSKRVSSPRGDSKAVSDSRATSKSPIHASESDQSSEQSLPPSRTRRRNVRSVYATPVEDETPQHPGKDVVESPRSTRKRAGDRETTQQPQSQQDTPAAPTTTRRGRPPKTRTRRGEDASPVKGDPAKTAEAEEVDGKDAGSSEEVVKVVEGWRSPRTQKVQQNQGSPPSAQNKKGGKAGKVLQSVTQQMELVGGDATAAQDPAVKPKDEPLEEEPLVLPSASEAMEPETNLAISNIMDVDTEMQPLSPDSKAAESARGSSSLAQEESSPPEMPKKGRAAAANAVAAPSGNPALPPDTKASDVDPSSSTLRKILMEPQYVPASGSSSLSSTLLTTSLGDPRVSDNKTQSDTVIARPSPPEDRPSPATPQPTVQQPPLPPPEIQQTFSEKMVNSVIASTVTSVISRIPVPFDSEEAPRISLSDRNAGMQLPKQKYRPSGNETNRYHGLAMGEEGAAVGRPGVESAAYSTGSSPRLRVNTSQGVVVLSCSGQKTEGPQRVIAKISQIPPASAVDIEFQQSVSKSQIKQEPFTPSQPTTPKGSQTPTGYGHPGGILSQAYNTQHVISSIKQESPGSDKTDMQYHPGPQGKINQQAGSNPQVLVYSQAMIQQHGKKAMGTESLPLKGDVNKPPQPSNISPGLSPHHPSLAGNYVSSSPGTPIDRPIPHPSGIKQEPHSPRTSGHSPSPFSKTCPPNTSTSPIGTSVVLGPGKPCMSQYTSGVHHQEQSVIMPPHSVNQTVAMGHLSQGEVRMNTPPLSAMGYGIRPEPLASPRPGPQQRSTTPQPAGIRDLVLQSLPGSAGSVGGSGSSVSGDDESRHYHQSLCRPSVPQLQPEVMVMQPDYRALHHGGMRLEQYGLPPRILMRHQLGEHPAPESRQTRTPEAAPLSSSSSGIPSSSSKTPPAGKGVLGRDPPKALEAKMPSSPHGESRIMGVHPSVPVMVSPQGVQMMQTGAAGSFSEYSSVYRDMRGFHHQFPGHSPLGINLASRSITPSQGLQDGDHGHRSKTPLSSSGAAAERGEAKPSESLIHGQPGSVDLPHLPRLARETSSPTYTSPTAVSHKLELGPSAAGQKGSPSFLSSPLPSASGPSQVRMDGKAEHTGHRPLDMVQLLLKYPIVWQGHLALKNDTAAVQLHLVSGNNVLAHRSLPPPEGGPLLRIAQRMRLEGSQLEGVARRMTVESDYCLLLALPCGRDQEDVLSQTHALTGGFITYLQAKLAAGIINVPNPGSNQPAYVLHIFPPCEFSESHLSRLAPDLLNSISSISPHLMIVIASV
ncbi:hypothetical protein ANANG_G00245780 [Anguilla anguilla]|uniref:Msx2-interacting protein n=1 Tax=Anguilla anguilla TaxID=7936 RepID=A0A9D3LR77_ANGAN|nr:hypothetical protein ANANG_G00245780 [Anguilla anguilla]